MESPVLRKRNVPYYLCCWRTDSTTGDVNSSAMIRSVMLCGILAKQGSDITLDVSECHGEAAIG